MVAAVAVLAVALVRTYVGGLEKGVVGDVVRVVRQQGGGLLEVGLLGLCLLRLLLAEALECRTEGPLCLLAEVLGEAGIAVDT